MEPFLKRRVSTSAVMSADKPDRLSLDVTEAWIVAFGESDFAAASALTFCHNTERIRPGGRL